jgi:hypothetical protein
MRKSPMNERFFEMASRASKEAFPFGSMAWMEVFAELIVRECAAQAEEESSWPYSSFGKKIKQHFGVEE